MTNVFNDATSIKISNKEVTSLNIVGGEFYTLNQ